MPEEDQCDVAIILRHYIVNPPPPPEPLPGPAQGSTSKKSVTGTHWLKEMSSWLQLRKIQHVWWCVRDGQITRKHVQCEALETMIRSVKGCFNTLPCDDIMAK